MKGEREEPSAARQPPEDRRRQADSRRPYRPPQLDVLGDVRDLTLAGRTPGTGDSQFANFRP